MSSEREKKLEDVLAQFIKPIKGVPFEVVIKGLCDVEVVKFDLQIKDNKIIISRISEAMRNACQSVQANPIERPRPNEVGNDMEPFVINSLKAVGLDAATPKTRHGKGKSTGYPDVRIEADGLPVYFEVKTYAAQNHDTTQRSFYLSPSDDPKVIEEAYHLVVGFEIEDRGANGRKDNRGRELRDYVPVGFVIVDLYGLDCDMKSEFNSDNKRLYEENRILTKESVSSP